jgi:crotonobetainyl-CoA:carnitine CoA-transferase CaiB-like acyl-CoA transferase
MMSALPLQGFRVIELGTMIAAPFATHILAQLGAEIIKIEPPTGDTTRALVRGGPSGTFIAYNHGKSSISIALDKPAGLDIFHRLVVSADVVIHNLSPAATRKLKITADDLAAINPGLIYCHIRGYAAGPQHDDLATNPVAEAATGVMENNRINGRPTRLGPSYHDQFAGAYAVIHILSTMLRKEPLTNERHIEIGLYETGLHVAARDLAGVQLKTQLLGHPEREGGGEFSMPGYGAYETADARWIYLLILTDAHWAKLTLALSMPEAEDPTLAMLRQRKKERERCENAVRRVVASLSFDEATAILKTAGLGFAEVVPLERVLDSPQARHQGKLRRVVFRDLSFDVPEFPGSVPVSDTGPPPELGEQTVEILRNLGVSVEEQSVLLRAGVVAETKAGDFAWAKVRAGP